MEARRLRPLLIALDARRDGEGLGDVEPACLADLLRALNLAEEFVPTATQAGQPAGMALHDGLRALVTSA